MLISPPFLPASDTNDLNYVAAAMTDGIDMAPGSSGAPLGSYPLTTAMTWHNGLHIRAPRDARGHLLPVRAIADGIVIFKRDPKPANIIATDPQNYNPYGLTPAWTDNGIVIVKHTTEIGATGTAGTALIYYSVYMHLSHIEVDVLESRPIWRKDVIGTAGQILGRDYHIHFEICLDATNLQNLLGAERSITWAEPAAVPSGNGRTDSVFGSIYIYLPAGTPIRTGAPTHHLQGQGGTNASRTSAATDRLSPKTLAKAQWVGIRYELGNAVVSSFRATEDKTLRSEVGELIGIGHLEKGFEYNLYTEANQRHISVTANGQTTLSSPSGWYELLRFGRKLGTDNLPINAAHWREIPTDTGTVWADLNAPGTHKFSDADFPAFIGWNCFDDDRSPDNQRCDSLEIKRLIRDSEAPESIRERATLAKRLGDGKVRTKLKRTLCKFPTEWDKSTIIQRYEWLQTDKEFQVAPGVQWEEFKAHAESISFEGLPIEYKNALWHVHPREFIGHMRQCGWLSMEELTQCIPREVVEQTKDVHGATIYPRSNIAWNTAANRAEIYKIEFNKSLRKYGISCTKLRLAYFFANSIQETIYFSRKSELGGAQTRYAPWYGRGFLQLTWEENYRRYGNFRGWQSEATASFRDSLEIDNARATDSAGYYWVTCAKPDNAVVCINLYADNVPILESSRLSSICKNYSYQNKVCLTKSVAMDYFPSTEFEKTARAVNTGNANSKGTVNGLIPRNFVFSNCLNVLREDYSLNVAKQRP
jgi:hypothetical protein